jgi:hypothetical protein
MGHYGNNGSNHLHGLYRRLYLCVAVFSDR